MKRILVTGATGFIGRQTLTPLLDHGYEVHAVYANHQINDVSGVIWHKSNLLALESAEKLCAEISPTHLLHFAWYVNAEDYKTSPENQKWEAATIALMQAFAKRSGKRAVLAGTCMEYDWNIPTEFFSEETSPIQPETKYGLAKNNAHIASAQIARDHGISFAWGRIFNLYGPHEAPRRLVPSIIHALANDTSPQISAGATVRDYSYVKNVAEAFVALADSSIDGTINVASGTPVSLKQMAEQIAGIMGKPELVTSIPQTFSPTEPERIVADVSKLRSQVGWHERYDLDAGLRETIAWWEESTKRTQ